MAFQVLECTMDKGACDGGGGEGRLLQRLEPLFASDRLRVGLCFIFQFKCHLGVVPSCVSRA